MINFGIYICIPRFRIFFGNLPKMNGFFSGVPLSWNLSVERLDVAKPRIRPEDPWKFNITMENHHAINGKSTISMVIFNSYVKLPEGKCWGKQTHFIFREVFAEV